MEHIHGTYDMSLVALSYLIAVLASYTTLDLAGHIRTARSGRHLQWVLYGAVAMGMGIWSMHFVGMLALKLPVNVGYDGGLVLVSMLAAVLGCFIALFIASRESRLSYPRLLLAGGILATGICVMHYQGMAAMLIPITYNPLIFIASIVIALIASVAALWLAFMFHRGGERYSFLKKGGSGLIMGAAVAGMHYTGMSAANFHAHQAMTSSPISDLFLNQKLLAYGIVSGTLITFGLSLAGIIISKRFAAKESRIRESETWYKALYDNNSDGIITIDLAHRVTGINPAAERLSGVKGHSFVGKPVSFLMETAAVGLTDNAKVIFERIGQGETLDYETVIINAKEQHLDLRIVCAPVEVNGTVVGIYLLLRDITEEKRKEAHIKQMAFEDELTGLPNRRKWQETVNATVREHTISGAPFAIFVLDIDRFKIINDSLGHQYGDLFLQEVSQRLRQSLEGRQAAAARLGGDEFTVLVKGDCSEANLIALTEEILQQIQRPYHLLNQDYYVSGSIGIAVYPMHGVEADQLLRHADLAMYEVKKQGKNGYRFYNSEMNMKLSEKVELERDLRQALAQEEMELYYQPQVRTSDGQMIGVEALVRWNHPTRGLLSPGVFIPLAEEIAQIGALGDWVLKEACRQMKAWHVAGGPLIPVSVNLSSQQFHQADLAEQISAILAESGLAPQYLELEITESMMMDVNVSTDILKRLNQLGVRISLDDFGTGYSSLSYLKLFPIHKLKIDRSFIRDITNNDSDKAIVATIISMAQHLQLDLIAEGIETKEQLDVLKDNACREIQGYYFSKPLPAGEVEESFFVPLRLTEAGIN